MLLPVQPKKHKNRPAIAGLIFINITTLIIYKRDVLSGFRIQQ